MSDERGLAFRMRRKHLDPIHAVSAAAQSAGPLPRSHGRGRTKRCRGIVEAQEIGNIGQAERAASAARVAHSKTKPRADRHDSQHMPVADASSRVSGDEGVVLIGFWDLRRRACNVPSRRLWQMGWKRWSMEHHPWAGRADIHTCQTKTRDMTRHGIRDIDISSRRVGPDLLCPDRNWREPPVTHPPPLNQQSINESDELRVSTTVTSSTKTTRAPCTRSTSDCKTTIHVTCEELSSPATQSSIRPRWYRPHSHTSPHRVLGEGCFGLQGCTRGSSPAVWTLLYDRRFPAVCDMPVALGDGLSPLLTFLWANKSHALSSFFETQYHRNLEGDSSPDSDRYIHLQREENCAHLLTTRASSSELYLA